MDRFVGGLTGKEGSGYQRYPRTPSELDTGFLFYVKALPMFTESCLTPPIIHAFILLTNMNNTFSSFRC